MIIFWAGNGGQKLGGFEQTLCTSVRHPSFRWGDGNKKRESPVGSIPESNATLSPWFR
jgi:hypothetical protein